MPVTEPSQFNRKLNFKEVYSQAEKLFPKNKQASKQANKQKIWMLVSQITFPRTVKICGHL